MDSYNTFDLRFVERIAIIGNKIHFVQTKPNETRRYFFISLSFVLIAAVVIIIVQMKEVPNNVCERSNITFTKLLPFNGAIKTPMLFGVPIKSYSK